MARVPKTKNKRINMAKAFDDMCAGIVPGTEEERGVTIVRTAMRVAMDEEHDQYGPQSRFIIDHMLGRATQKVEVSTPTGIQVDMSGGAMTFLGIKSIKGVYTDEDGDQSETTVTAEVERSED